MGRRISLREFQESLVRRLAEARSGGRRALLGVEAGSENWLFDLADSGEIMPVPALTPVPLTQPWYRGLANVRGTLHGVVDLSAFHKGPQIVPSGHARLLLVGTRHGVNCALLVSRASGLRNPEDFETAGTDDPRPWVAQRLKDMQDRTWLKIDVPKLLARPEFLDAGLQQS